MQENKLEAIITIRLSREEKKRVMTQAIFEGLQMSAFIRHIVLDYLNEKDNSNKGQ